MKKNYKKILAIFFIIFFLLVVFIFINNKDPEVKKKIELRNMSGEIIDIDSGKIVVSFNSTDPAVVYSEDKNNNSEEVFLYDKQAAFYSYSSNRKSKEQFEKEQADYNIKLSQGEIFNSCFAAPQWLEFSDFKITDFNKGDRVQVCYFIGTGGEKRAVEVIFLEKEENNPNFSNEMDNEFSYKNIFGLLERIDSSRIFLKTSTKDEVDEVLYNQTFECSLDPDVELINKRKNDSQQFDSEQKKDIYDINPGEKLMLHYKNKDNDCIVKIIEFFAE